MIYYAFFDIARQEYGERLHAKPSYDGSQRAQVYLNNWAICQGRMDARQLEETMEHIQANAEQISTIMQMTDGRAKWDFEAGLYVKDKSKPALSVVQNTVKFFSGADEISPMQEAVLKLYNSSITKWIAACREQGLLQALFQGFILGRCNANFAQVRTSGHLFEFLVFEGANCLIEITKDGKACELDDPDLEAALAKAMLFKNLGVS